MASNSISKGSKKNISAAGAPALIEYKQMKFLIINNPTAASLPNFISELERHNAKTVVRCCEPSYSASPLKEKGITVVFLSPVINFNFNGTLPSQRLPRWLNQSIIKAALFQDLQFDDGGYPDTDIVTQWMELVNDTFKNESTDCSVAVHCVAGLGRAPVLVAVALIERGMKYHEAVGLIRSKRRGAINQKQLTFLETYKASNKCRIM